MPTTSYKLDREIWEHLFSLGPSFRHAAGDVLYMQGERGTGLVCLKSGKIKNCSYFANGAEKLLCILEAPAITNETAVVDDGGNICSAVALTNVEVVIISRKTAQEFLMGYPDLMMMMLRVFAEKIRSMQFQAQSTVMPLAKKLAVMLLNFHEYGVFSEQENGSTRLNITHDQLSGFLGTTRPKVTDALNSFAQRGLIRKGRGYIEIIDQDGLRRLIEV